MVVTVYRETHRSITGNHVLRRRTPAKWLTQATVDETTQIGAPEMRKLTLDAWRCSPVKMVHGIELHLADTVTVP